MLLWISTNIYYCIAVDHTLSDDIFIIYFSHDELAIAGPIKTETAES